MGTRSRGRGLVAVVGLVVLLVGVVGAAVLFVISQRRPEQVIDGFARATVGCDTVLEFNDIGEFYVFEERAEGPAAQVGECPPVADPERSFGFVLRDDDGPVVTSEEIGVSYETDGRSGRSIAVFEVTEQPSTFVIEVVGDDLAVVAAIGREPYASADAVRRQAFALGAAAVLLGGLLLIVSGRRSRRAAAPANAPAGATWERPSELGDASDDRAVARVPVGPDQGPGLAPPIAVAAPLPKREPAATLDPPPGERAGEPPPEEPPHEPVQPWAPPTADRRVDDPAPDG